MSHDNKQTDYNILWEKVDNPRADELLRQAIDLILRDLQELSPETRFDNASLSGLNEGVPVEECE